MTTLRHPNMNDTTCEVPDDQVDAWVAQGWLRDDQKPTRKSPSATGEGK